MGKGVTFVMHGETNLKISNGSLLNIKAPLSGPMRGLVISQELGNKPMNSPKYPDVTTKLTSGGVLNLLGTVYLPTHRIEFSGGSISETRAPATSFIAHQISIGDGANIAVAVDHVKAEIPPILPRSDDGARLVR